MQLGGLKISKATRKFYNISDRFVLLRVMQKKTILYYCIIGKQQQKRKKTTWGAILKYEKSFKILHISNVETFSRDKIFNINNMFQDCKFLKIFCGSAKEQNISQKFAIKSVAWLIKNISWRCYFYYWKTNFFSTIDLNFKFAK